MSCITKPTKIILEHIGGMTLRPGDYITQGGEGAIYKKGKNIIKLYLDPSKMVHDQMVQKVHLLRQRMQHDAIVAPQGVVLDAHNKPIGYHMKLVQGEPFPRMFTNGFRAQTGLDTQGVTVLTTAMHEVVRYAHDHQALMVDANELNWLADVHNIKRPKPYVIDVDSWAIDRFKASVMMPSIRDWHSTGVSPQTDWFAWGIVSFLLYTGIHPYKGKLANYKPGNLKQRMQDNASVFLPEVRLNHAVRDFTEIPGPLLDWYYETFQNGFRGPAPVPSQTGVAKMQVARTMRIVATNTGGLVYEQLMHITNDPIVSVWPCGIVRTKSGDLYRVTDTCKIGTSDATRIAIVRVEQGWLLAEEKQGIWEFRYITNKGAQYVLPAPAGVTNLIRSDERMFMVTDNALVELSIQMFTKPLLTTGTRWSIMGASTHWYQGVGVSNVLGATYLIVPFGEDAVAFVKAPELDDKKVIAGVAGMRYVEILTVDQAGIYQVTGFAFDAQWKNYTTHTRITDSAELNTAVLPKGVTATIADDGELVVAVPCKGEQKLITDSNLSTTMRLAHIGNQVVYRHNDALWSLRMR